MNDITNYSYPILSIQAKRSKRNFIKYVFELINLGLGKKLIFYVYVLAILILGSNLINKIIKFIKKTIGFTPSIGRSPLNEKLK